MPGIARANQDSAGGLVIEGSPNVFVENKPVVRVGDHIQGHGDSPHDNPVMAQGSPNIFVNGIAVCRAGDLASCGHPVSGSSTVFGN